MELLRPDFATYLAEMRNALRAVRSELQTDKSRNDIACMLRMLAMIEAEHGERRDGLAAALDVCRAIARDLAGLAGALPGIADELAALDPAAAASDDAAIDAHRLLFQRRLPALAALAREGDAAAAALRDRIARADADGFGRTQRRYDGILLADAQADAPRSAKAVDKIGSALLLDREALGAYLREIFPGEDALKVASVHAVPGGRSKETSMITLEGVRTLPARIVMRRDIEGGLVPSKTVDEYGLLKVAAGTPGVPVPTPLHCETDKSRLGSTFILVEAMPGSTQGDYFPDENAPTENKEEIGRQLAGILARLHSIPLSAYERTAVDTNVDLVEEMRGEIVGILEEARGAEQPSRVLIEVAAAWLLENLERGRDDPRVIHRDIGLHNMLIEGGRITALLDWELARVASPAREIAKILHLIEYLMPLADFLAEYEAAGGPPSACDGERLNFYAVLNYMSVTQRCRYGSTLFFTGQMPGVVMGSVGYDSYYRCTSLLTRALEQVNVLQTGPGEVNDEA